MAEPKIGDRAPDFDLPRDSGGNVTLAEFRGKPLVLFFYPQDDTETCTMEAISFTQLKPDFDAAGIAMLGVSPDTVKSHCKFRDKHGLTVNLAADEQRTLIEAYGLWVEKQMFGRRYMGVERATVLIDGDGFVRRIWRKVRVKGHAAEVLQAARDLTG